MNAALDDVPECRDRASRKCGGATVCGSCLEAGLSRATRKLLKGSVAAHQLGAMVATAWPEASAHECAAVASALVSRKKAVTVRGAPASSASAAVVVEHALWAFLRDFQKHAVQAEDPVDCARLNKLFWLVPLITPARLLKAGLHVVEQPGTARVLARQRTFLNATDIDELDAALHRRGLSGTPTSVVFEEYDGAFEDLHELAAQKTLVIDEGLVWHAAVVGSAVPGALKVWRGIAGLYDGSK